MLTLPEMKTQSTKILREFTSDYTGEIHYAQRADGQWFTRNRFKDQRYGYRNSAWRMTASTPGERAMEVSGSARLPK